MTLTQNSNISYFEKKVSKVSQSVTKFTKHSFRDGGGGWWVGEWWWKPILVYSSGPTFELELELELDLTWPWPDHVLTLTLTQPWVGPWAWQKERFGVESIIFEIAQCVFSGIGLICCILPFCGFVMPLLIFTPVDFINGIVFIIMVEYVLALCSITTSSDQNNQLIFFQLHSSSTTPALFGLIFRIPILLCFTFTHQVITLNQEWILGTIKLRFRKPYSYLLHTFKQWFKIGYGCKWIYLPARN